jgi:hypothetical protein
MRTRHTTSTRTLGFTLGLGLMCMLLGMNLSADDAAPASETESVETKQNQPPRRVIVHVNRNLTVAGVLELLDDEVVVIRDLHDEVQSFSRGRVLQIIVLVDPDPGQTGVVFLANGQTRDGVVLEDHYDYVLMEIEGVRARISRANVDRVVLEPTFQQRYEQYKAQLLPGQTRRHLALCQWLVDNKAWELAKLELEALLTHEQDFEARKLLNLVDAQLTLQQGGFRSTDEQRSQQDDPHADPKTGPVYARDLLPSTLITDEDVNIIRVYEIDFADPPRLSISPETIRTLIESYGTNELLPASQAGRTALFRADAVELARLMFELRARELYPKINVLSEPPALNEFRLRVHDAWIINNCATSRCHGGPDAGALFLHNQNYKSDRVRYTNLLILERLELEPEWPLINYDEPMLSLIIQHALPRHAARKPHPDVPGWTPVFTRGNRRTLDASIAWMQSMYQPRPEYPVDYDPPKLKAQPPAPKQ